MGLGFPVFSNKTGSNRTGKNKKKPYILRDWVSRFFPKKPDLTEPDQFGLNWFPVWFG